MRPGTPGRPSSGEELWPSVTPRRSPANAAPSAEFAALHGERHRLLIEAIGQLKDDDQTVIHIRYFLEFSETEMAVALGCRPGTVWSRISRASRRLKVLIEKRFPDLAEEYQGVRS